MNAKKMGLAIERAEAESVLGTQDVLGGLLPLPRRWNGLSIGPMSLGHLLVLARLGNPFAQACMGVEVSQLEMVDQMKSDQEVIFVLCHDASEVMEWMREGCFGSYFEKFISKLPLSVVADSGLIEVLGLCVRDSRESYLAMEAAGGGAGKKLRSLG